jgi:hypothetical protein
MLTGDAYDGLFLTFDGIVIELVDAAMIGTAGTAIERATIDGALFLPWPQVAYLQCP